MAEPESKDSKGSWRKLSRMQKVIICAIIVAILYTVTGFLILPPVMKNVLEKKITATLNRPATIEKISFNPYVFTATIDGFHLRGKNKGDSFVGFQRLFLDVEAVSLFKRALIVKAVQLDRPAITLARLEDNTYNFSDLIQPASKKEEKKDETGFHFSVNNIEIAGGTVDFEDRPTATTHHISDLSLGLPFISNLEHLVAINVQPRFSAVVNGTPVSLAGKSKPFLESRETDFDISIKAFNLPYYMAYLPAELKFAIASGILDADLKFTFVQQVGSTPRMWWSGSFSLADLAVVDSQQQSLLNFDALTVEIDSFSLLEKNLHLLRTTCDSTRLWIRKNEEGVINLKNLFPATENKNNDFASEKTTDPWHIQIDDVVISDTAVLYSDATVTRVDDKKGNEIIAIPEFSIRGITTGDTGKDFIVGSIASSNGEFNILRDKSGSTLFQELFAGETSQSDMEQPRIEKKGGTAGYFTLKRIALEDYSIIVTDEQPSEPATLIMDQLKLQADNITTRENHSGTVDFSCRPNKQGNIRITGQLAINPVQINLKSALDTIAVKPLQPYIRDQVNIIVADGTISAKVEIDISASEEDGIALRLQGDSAATDFTFLDPLHVDQLVAWNAIEVGGISASTHPTKLSIQQILLQEPSLHIHIDQQGGVNLASLLTGQDEEEKQEGLSEEAETGEKPSVSINRIAISNGKVEVLDESITPYFSTSLDALTGEIVGLTSEQNILAKVNISGKQDQHSPFSITGELNPLQENPYINLTMDLADFDMSRVSPYSGKYVAHPLQRGKLSLDLGYRIEGTKLQADNQIFIDQIALGEQVESPDAIKVPIRLAIALLQNRAGEIRLNVPVSGDLGDPEFSLAGAFFQVLLNIITKAITSPFAVLGALAGGGEDLQFMEFAAGSAEINDQARNKLEAITKIMYERPGLKLEVLGHAEPVEDRERMRQEAFQRLLKVEKYKETAKKDRAVTSMDSIEIRDEEKQKYLLKAYEAATFARPKNNFGMLIKQPGEKMEKMLFDHIEMSNNDLLLLAAKRAGNVRDFLITSGNVESERVFLVDAVLVELAGEQGSATKRRVEMIIK